MPDKGSALFLTPEAPYPVIGGGAMRSACILEFLAGRYDVDVIAFRESHWSHPADTMAGRGFREISAIELPRNSNSFPARARRNFSRYLRRIPPLNDRYGGFDERLAELLRGKQYEVAVVEHFWCASYWKLLRPRCRRLVLDLHNVESVLYGRSAGVSGSAPGWMMQGFARASEKLERAWIPQYDTVLVTSPADEHYVRGIVPQARPVVVPNAVPWKELPERNEANSIVFTGHLGYHPNVAAIAWFRHQVWPLVREEHPDLIWRVVGRSPETVAHLLKGDRRIDLVGEVPDALPYLASAKAAIVPILSGSGTRIKILEAWAAGTPVVSTTVGAEGLHARHKEHLLVADSSEDFAQNLGNLLRNATLREAIGTGGRALLERDYTWPACWKRLADIGL